MKEQIEKCDYCEKDAKYHQTFVVWKIETDKIETSWLRSACEIHKDHTED